MTIRRWKTTTARALRNAAAGRAGARDGARAQAGARAPRVAVRARASRMAQSDMATVMYSASQEWDFVNTQLIRLFLDDRNLIKI